MNLTGKGVYIWKAAACENGNPEAVAHRARAAGLSHVLVKVADGARPYNRPLAASMASALQAAGVQVWGWQYVYGEEPDSEAEAALTAAHQLRLDGFVVNAEREYEDKFQAADAYMERLGRGLGATPIALSSFRFPDFHPAFPWTEFLSQCSYNMPQIFWINDPRPARQLDQSLAQFRHIYPGVPILPTAPAYVDGAWRPSAAEIAEFAAYVQQCGLAGLNFWNWDYAGSAAGRDLWQAISAIRWSDAGQAGDTIDVLFSALNRGDVDAIVTLYEPDGVLVTPSDTLRGTNELRSYYASLLSSLLPQAEFSIQERINEQDVGHISWSATSRAVPHRVTRGEDTIGLREGRIQYHTSLYRIV